MKKSKQASVEQISPVKAADVIKYILSHSCIYFTAATLVLLFIIQITSGSESEKAIEPSRFLLIYPFTFAFALADCIFKVRSLGTAAKVFIHYAIVVISFYAFVCAPAKSAANPIVIIVFMSLVYFIIATPILIVRHSIKKKKEKEVPYQSIYVKTVK